MYVLLFSIILIHVNVKYVFVDCCITGEYGPWNPWENCSQTCGGGIERRWRSFCCPAVNGIWTDCLALYNKTDKYIFAYQPCSEICFNGGTFINGTGCVCSAGYQGKCCSTDIDECASTPCQHGGSCIDGINCYNCTCVAGFTGSNCETDIDECASTPCQHGGSCIDGVNRYNCTCVAGFSGSNCETDTDECASDPCLHGGICVDGVNVYNCTCPAGFLGANCEADINECDTNPCYNGGTCYNNVGYYNCTCPPGYVGLNCTIDINECDGDPCFNRGTCTDEVGSFKCKCPPEFTGHDCSIEVDSCAYSVLTTCRRLSGGGHHRDCKKVGDTNLCLYELLTILGILAIAAVTSCVVWFLAVRRKRKVRDTERNHSEKRDTGETIQRKV